MTISQQKQNQIIVRTLKKNPLNKYCADCGIICPVNVDTTNGVFLCTNCSIIHRELGFQVKSISIDTFTQEEVDKLQTQTNESFNQIWMAKMKDSEKVDISNEEEDIRRKFIKSKYIEKKWLQQKDF